MRNTSANTSAIKFNSVPLSPPQIPCEPSFLKWCLGSLARSINNEAFLCLKLILTQMNKNFRLSVTGLSARGPGIDTREVRVGFVVDKVTLEWLFLRIHRFLPLIISPVLIPIFNSTNIDATLYSEH